MSLLLDNLDLSPMINSRGFPTTPRLKGICLPRETPDQIICGDCSGDNYTPLRTLRRIDGTCAQCGGRSFVLASTLAINLLARQLIERSKQS